MLRNHKPDSDDATPRADVWIVLPTLNEAGNIVPLLAWIKHEMADHYCTVCIVDGGSKDGTAEKARDFGRSEATASFSVEVIPQRKLHRGAQRGGAVLTGMSHGLQHSNWNVFVEMDADLAHSPHDLHKGIRAIVEQRYNVAIASKYCPESHVVGRPAFRRFLSITYNSLLRAFLSRDIRDFSNGYRFYDPEAIKLLCAERIRYTSPVHLVDVLATLLTAGNRVVEFPSSYTERKRGASKITILDYVKAGAGATEIVIRHRMQFTRTRQGRKAT